MAASSKIIFLLFVFSFLSFSFAKVLNLDETSFDEEMEKKDKVFFIKFFAPWCGHCKRLAPTWNELSDEFSSSDNVEIAHVDCTSSRPLCEKFEIGGYPTLKLFHGGEDKKRYQGPRDLASLKLFVEEYIKEAQLASL